MVLAFPGRYFSWALPGSVPNEAREGFVMMTVAARGTRHHNRLDVVANAFRQKEGLAFAEVLSAERIKQAFQEKNGLFGQDDLFSTDIVLWAFPSQLRTCLAQTLRDGKGAACAAAVADIATYMLQTGQRPPSGDTGDYCRARAKLSLMALRRLVVESAQHVEREANASWLWKGLHAKLVDGFTFTMPDTPENQAAFPQPAGQARGVGFPIARCCAVVSLATACVCDLAVGPYEGKQTGELALLRDLLNAFDENDLVVFDRYYCSYPDVRRDSCFAGCTFAPGCTSVASVTFAKDDDWGTTITWLPGRVRPGRSGCPRRSMPGFPRR